MTIGDLIKNAEPPTPATREQIARKLAMLETQISPLFDSLVSIAAGIAQCRALLSDDEGEQGATDEPDVDSPSRAADAT